MGNIITWLTTTPLGLAAALGGLVVVFTLVALLYELRTRSIYPDSNRRGTKALSKAKAARKAANSKDADDTDDDD